MASAVPLPTHDVRVRTVNPDTVMHAPNDITILLIVTVSVGRHCAESSGRHRLVWSLQYEAVWRLP